VRGECLLARNHFFAYSTWLLGAGTAGPAVKVLPGGRLVLGPYPTHEGALQCLAACPAMQQKGIVKGNNQGTFAVGSLRTARARVRLVDFFLAVEAEGGWPLVTSLYWNFHSECMPVSPITLAAASSPTLVCRK